MTSRTLKLLVATVIVTTSASAAWSQTAAVSGAAAPPPPTFRLTQIGPLAPIPEVVAMQLPTGDELQQINGAIRKLIDTDKSDAAPLLKKYQSLLLVAPPRLNVAATYTQTPQRMGPRHVGFVETAKAGSID